MRWVISEIGLKMCPKEVIDFGGRSIREKLETHHFILNIELLGRLPQKIKPQKSKHCLIFLIASSLQALEREAAPGGGRGRFLRWGRWSWDPRGSKVGSSSSPPSAFSNRFLVQIFTARYFPHLEWPQEAWDEDFKLLCVFLFRLYHSEDKAEKSKEFNHMEQSWKSKRQIGFVSDCLNMIRMCDNHTEDKTEK